tara:strand:+ start:367 stop:1026 length:660 start_codon:yes stop_codon:yes gene_type:complete
MEKRTIPITFGNEKLQIFFGEIIEYYNNFGNYKFQIISKEALQNYDKNIIITDDEFFINQESLILAFSLIFVIKSHDSNLKKTKFNNEIIILDIPLRIQDMFQRVSASLDQIEKQNSKKLKFRESIYDPGMRTLYNGNLNIRFTEKESQIFMCLLDNSNTQISKKNLLKKVWSYNEDIDTHTLETHIYSLRKKIEKNLKLKDLIIFLDNKGYFLNKKIL